VYEVEEDEEEDGGELDDDLAGSDDGTPYGFNPFVPGGGMRFGFNEDDLEEVFISPGGRGGGSGGPECQQQ
jgi:hypothetical protein